MDRAFGVVSKKPLICPRLPRFSYVIFFYRFVLHVGL